MRRALALAIIVGLGLAAVAAEQIPVYRNDPRRTQPTFMSVASDGGTLDYVKKSGDNMYGALTINTVAGANQQGLTLTDDHIQVNGYYILWTPGLAFYKKGLWAYAEAQHLHLDQVQSAYPTMIRGIHSGPDSYGLVIANQYDAGTITGVHGSKALTIRTWFPSNLADGGTCLDANGALVCSGEEQFRVSWSGVVTAANQVVVLDGGVKFPDGTVQTTAVTDTDTSKAVYSGRSSAALTATAYCFPQGMTSCGVDDTLVLDQAPVPFAGTIRSLRAWMDPAQDIGDTCDVYVRAGTCSSALSNTNVDCRMADDVESCSDLSDTATVGAGDCIQVSLVETAGSCNGVLVWSFELGSSL